MAFGEKLELKGENNVRVRIAPSPTGFLHIGLARAALFNYLFAKQNSGSFVLRIEDTDLERSALEFEKDIIESLEWLGLDWDEGPGKNGLWGPYRQTERTDVYEKYLKKLFEDDKAYYCFCSQEELEAQRQYQMSRGEAPRYSGKCASLDKETARLRASKGDSFVIRFRVPAKKIEFNDLIRGKLEFDSELIGDIVIAKNFSTALYNFAVAVDDFEMRISHVIRGEDHISNTPKQILIQEALGFPHPIYAHLPLILGPDRTKLSKRHGATSVTEFKRQGYLAEALINFMAFLGWNPGNDKEIYSLPALIKEFSLEKTQKSGAVFNIKKLDFINGFYIRQKSLEALTELCLPYLQDKGLVNKDNIDIVTVQKAVSLYRERLKKLSEIADLVDFFFKEPFEYKKDLLRWGSMVESDVKKSLEIAEKTLSDIQSDRWTKEIIEQALLKEAEKLENRGILLWPLRVALTGKESSAGPFEIAEVLGKETALKRIRYAKNL